jgi:hypothetical protein
MSKVCQHLIIYADQKDQCESKSVSKSHQIPEKPTLHYPLIAALRISGQNNVQLIDDAMSVFQKSDFETDFNVMIHARNPG